MARETVIEDWHKIDDGTIREHDCETLLIYYGAINVKHVATIEYRSDTYTVGWLKRQGVTHYMPAPAPPDD
jgi:hypothetical protein